MFTKPNTEIPSQLIEASAMIDASNTMLTQITQFQKEQFRKFWLPGGQLRSKESVNAILAAMDGASPGQSAQFFLAAKALADLILALAPGSLGESDWMPPYEYTVDPVTYSLRVI